MSASQTERFVSVRHEGAVAIITYDRPHRRHAWDVGMYRAITAAIEQADADEAIGAILLTATGPVFCAGADMKAPREPRDPVTGRRPDMATLAMAPLIGWPQLLARAKPSIVAVQGAAIGLGVTHILSADIRVAARSARFAFPFLELGTMPELGSTALLARLVGEGRARHLCLSAATIDAEEALRIGLVSLVVDDECLMPEAIALASRIAGHDRDAVRLTRELLSENAGDGIEAVLARERSAFTIMIRRRGTRFARMPLQAPTDPS